MIELYAKGTTDFTKHGIALAATQAAVTYQDNGQYDMDLTMPYNALIAMDYGMILRCPVPKQSVGQITLGTVSYWEVASGESNVPLYKSVPVTNVIKYDNWVYGQEYAAGAKVSFDNKNYQAATAIVEVLTTGAPPALPNNWTQIARVVTSGGEVLNSLNAGDTVVKTGDFSSTYMKAADTAGHEGFIQISKCTDMSETETRIVPAFTITNQSFTITEIKKSSDKKTVTIHAEHISYQLGRVMLGDCNISRATPATAIALMRGAMMESYPGAIETNLTEGTITGDWSWKNAQSAILDPKAGLLQGTTGHMIRNDLDVYILAEGNTDPSYRITYGTNMKAVKWDGNIGNLVTRIYPVAQNEDGSTLLLPEKYIDTVRTIPYVRPEALKTSLKVGQKEKQEDGTEITLDIDTVYARMREQAGNRFNIDECDKAEISVEVDWLHLPDTEEYAEFAALQNAAPGDWVLVQNSPLGIDVTIQMTGYTFDPILMRYQKGTFGKKTTTASIASYNIKNGAVGSSALGSGAVGNGNIQAGVVTAREIEAHSITADLIASKSITTELIMANAITADEINAAAITAAKIAANAITAEKIAAGAITAEAIGALVIQAQHIASGAIVTDKLAAGAVEASKIAAQAVTAEKVAAGAITAEKIAAGAISAAKIDTTDLAAINATLGTANIADARIALADIDYAKVKDLTAGSAYFGQAVIQAGVANKLFIPRLAVDYAQIVSATIGDLVIQATNDNYYKLDVDLDGKVTATQVTPTAEEIAAGHTSDGRTIYTATEITASELNTTDIYASHALMDEITANIINTDQLFAREATIAQINAMDLSSNTYIRSVVGDWASQSTITQTINGINTRITSLGYGTFYYSTTEPDHNNLVAGDVWIEPIEDNTWDDIAQYTWDQLANWTWDYVMGQYRMYVWTGSRFRQLFDNMFITDLQTQIDQNAYAITLKANQSVVDELSGDVSDFATTLELQSQAITAAVATVNAKTSGFVQYSDPSEEYEIHLGDTWTKSAFQPTWDGISGMTWEQVAEFTWDDLAGPKTYVWNGTEWIEVSDQSMTYTLRTQIEESDRQISLLAEEQLTIGDQVYSNLAQIRIQATQITQEVERAQNAEAGKLDKTTQYQTADAIVSEAVRQSATSAEGLYIAKTTSYQTADAIVSEAVRQAANSAEGSYLKKTSTYQTAESIVSAAQTYTNGQLTSYSTTAQTSEMISAYVTNNAYTIKSGIAIEAAGVTVSGGKYVKIESSGTFSVTASTFGIRSDISETYAIWSGGETAATSPFRVKPDGSVYVTKLIALDENGNESNVNLRTSGLWKLNYHTIKSHTESSMTLSNGDVINFSRPTVNSVTVGSKLTGAIWNVSVALSNGDTLPSTANLYTVDFESTGYWSNGSRTISLQNGRTTTVSLPASASFTRSVGVSGETVYCNVGGKTYSTYFAN